MCCLRKGVTGLTEPLGGFSFTYGSVGNWWVYFYVVGNVGSKGPLR